jgi:ATP-binding cassette, subfamily B, bacterial HlyB/CyaB
LGDLLNAPPEPSYNPNRTTLPSLTGHVIFDKVTFRYRLDGTEVLRKLSLEIPAGKVIGVVGRSGSGKSTIAKLIQRLYVPEAGRVLIDGVDLAQVDPAWLRRQIGVVLQENFLFNRSVRDNIALPDPGLPMEQVMQRPSWPARMSSSWNCRTVTTPWSANTAARSPAASASVSPSPAPW